MPSVTQITPLATHFSQGKIHLTWAHALKILTMGLSTRFKMPSTITVPRVLHNKLILNSQSVSREVAKNLVSIMLVTYCSCCTTTKTGYSLIFNPHFPIPNELPIIHNSEAGIATSAEIP